MPGRPRLLRRARRVAAFAQARDTPVSPRLVARIRHRYRQWRAEALTYHEGLPRLKAPGKSRPRRRLGHHLALSLQAHEDATLRFLTDPAVSFTHNTAEHDRCRAKIRQKVSGSWRTVPGATDFAVRQSVVTTARKQGGNRREVLRMAPAPLAAALDHAIRARAGPTAT